MSIEVSDFYNVPFCVYAHFVDDQLIYIGSGELGRAFNINCRKRHHQQMLERGRTKVVILSRHADRQEAFATETTMLKTFLPPANIIHAKPPVARREYMRNEKRTGLSTSAEIVLEMIIEAAKNNEPAPTNNALKQAVGCSESNIARIIKMLSKHRYIEIQNPTPNSRVFIVDHDRYVPTERQTVKKTRKLRKESRMILGMLTHAAENNLPCPSNADIAAITGSRPTSITATISSMAKRGIVSVELCPTGRIIHVGEHSTKPTANMNVKGVPTVKRETRAVDRIIV